ncbi:fucose-specific lectin [Fusarium agapanthi]|uniref:Fucose-specific lectin n=1 Tax=Fusarium agapanthi TaxID=1803897 RepID=A0A9P5BDN5_9HYPO|nr:fucose-specific lectin [Fusarium agapanthi]
MPSPDLNTDIPTPTIDSATYYDVGSQQLYLTITYPNGALDTAKGVEVKIITSSSTTPTFVGNGPVTFEATNKGTFVTGLLSTLASQEGQIIAAGLDTESWQSSPPSDPWQIPAINPTPFTSPPSATFTSLGSLEVTWTWIAGMDVTAQEVTLTIAGQTLPPVKVEKPSVTATFTMAQANNLFTPGAKVAIQCTPITPGLWATPLNTTFHIPTSTVMASFLLNSSPLVSPECTMASFYVPGTNDMQVWWTTPAGAIETAQSPLGSWDEHSQQFAGASTVSDTGSCLASMYANSANQQVWWITAAGAIDGQVNTGKGWASPGTGPGEKFPFNQAGVASTTNGGSMTSLLLEGDIGMILFWVDPKGGIGCCRWINGSGWQPVSEALPAGSASTTAQLTSQAIGSTAYLYFVTPDGAIVSSTWSDAGITGSGLMSQSTVAASGSASTDATLASAVVSSQEIAVFWTTPKNSIQMILQFRNIERPLTVAQSVLGGTGIAAYSMETNQCSIWWIGQSNDLRRSNVDFTKIVATVTPTWPVFEEVGPGSCKQARSLIVQTVSGTRINVLYANTKGVLSGLAYQS